MATDITSFVRTTPETRAALAREFPSMFKEDGKVLLGMFDWILGSKFKAEESPGCIVMWRDGIAEHCGMSPTHFNLNKEMARFEAEVFPIREFTRPAVWEDQIATVLEKKCIPEAVEELLCDQWDKNNIPAAPLVELFSGEVPTAKSIESYRKRRLKEAKSKPSHPVDRLRDIVNDNALATAHAIRVNWGKAWRAADSQEDANRWRHAIACLRDSGVPVWQSGDDYSRLTAIGPSYLDLPSEIREALFDGCFEADLVSAGLNISYGLYGIPEEDRFGADVWEELMDLVGERSVPSKKAVKTMIQTLCHGGSIRTARKTFMSACPHLGQEGWLAFYRDHRVKALAAAVGRALYAIERQKGMLDAWGRWHRWSYGVKWKVGRDNRFRRVESNNKRTVLAAVICSFEQSIMVEVAIASSHEGDCLSLAAYVNDAFLLKPKKGKLKAARVGLERIQAATAIVCDRMGIPTWLRVRGPHLVGDKRPDTSAAGRPASAGGRALPSLHRPSKRKPHCLYMDKICAFSPIPSMESHLGSTNGEKGGFVEDPMDRAMSLWMAIEDHEAVELGGGAQGHGPEADEGLLAAGGEPRRPAECSGTRPCEEDSDEVEGKEVAATGGADHRTAGGDRGAGAVAHEIQAVARRPVGGELVLHRLQPARADTGRPVASWRPHVRGPEMVRGRDQEGAGG